MARRRFFVDRIARGEAEITGDDAVHLSRVLRVEPGQRYEISDGESLYLAEISLATKSRVHFRVLESLPFEEPSLQVALIVSLIKFDRFEWIVEKATELGATSIVPWNAQRSEKGLHLAAEKRIERWRKIARESSQQSRRVRPPLILPVGRIPPGIAHRYYLEEAGGAPRILAALPGPADRRTTVALAIGPEGGWADPERAAWLADGYSPLSLGPQILRAETAAIAALAVLIQAW